MYLKITKRFIATDGKEKKFMEGPFKDKWENKMDANRANKDK